MFIMLYLSGLVEGFFGDASSKATWYFVIMFVGVVVVVVVAIIAVATCVASMFNQIFVFI